MKGFMPLIISLVIGKRTIILLEKAGYINEINTFFIIATIVMMLFASCSHDSSPKTYKVVFLGPDGKIAITHEVVIGEKVNPPAQGEMGENREFYWSHEEDGDELYDFNTPVTENIVLYPIAKSKRVVVDFFYRDGIKIRSKLYKVGAKVSISDLGFNNNIYTLKLYDIITGNEHPLNSALQYKEEGYNFCCDISSSIINIEGGSISGTTDLNNIKVSYTLNIPRILNGDTVKSIKENGFSSKIGEKPYSFNKVIIHDTVNLIGEKAFLNCSNLSEVTLSGELNKLSDYVFVVVQT